MTPINKEAQKDISRFLQKCLKDTTQEYLISLGSDITVGHADHPKDAVKYGQVEAYRRIIKIIDRWPAQ